jgi:diguanylate cyclase (GGDEF)-like protein
LDRFKLINDSIGHDAGDELLKTVAKRLEFTLRGTDTLARLGGDEFIVVTDSIKNELDAGIVATRLLDSFGSNFEIAGQSLSVSASAGISVFPRDGGTIGELLRNADAAMYQAKNIGGHQFQFYTAELGTQIKNKFILENELHEAVLKNEFVIHYQPQFDIATQQISSVEALIRWNHPKRGLLFPIDFIPAAEETGLIVPIGEWSLKTACEQNKKWQDAGYLPMRVAVNISLKQIKQIDFVQKIKGILDSSGLTPHWLELEITENVLLNAIELALSSLPELYAMGIHITLDDFGTGTSSINYLRKIPLDRLKIDQSFISNINLNTSDEVIIQSIISLAKNLNLRIVAEGVETQKQLEFLQSNHCEEVQGFYFSKPVSTSELEAILQKTKK